MLLAPFFTLSLSLILPVALLLLEAMLEADVYIFFQENQGLKR